MPELCPDCNVHTTRLRKHYLRCFARQCAACKARFAHVLDYVEGRWLCGGCSHLYDDTMGEQADDAPYTL